MEIGIMQAGVNVIQSLDLDPEATSCMKIIVTTFLIQY